MQIERKDGRVFIRVSRVDTRGRILDINDSINHHKILAGEGGEKVKFTATEYGENKPSQYFQHKMDLDDFMVLAFDLLVGKKEIAYVEFKGNPDDKYPTGYEAREFRVEWWKDGGHGAGAYNVILSRGPGKPGDKGQVSMDSAYKDKVETFKITLSIPEIRRLFKAGHDYFNNKQTAFLSLNWRKLFEEAPAS